MATEPIRVPASKPDIARMVPRLLYCSHHHVFTIDQSRPGNCAIILSQGAIECLQKVGLIVD